LPLLGLTLLAQVLRLAIGTAALQRLARELMPDRVSLRTNYK
jgi:hypothetical protein